MSGGKYVVTVAFTTFVDFEVDAEDEAEAREIYAEGDEMAASDPESDVRSVVAGAYVVKPGWWER